jgi:hypothetical protein
MVTKDFQNSRVFASTNGLMSPPSGELLSHGFPIQPDSLYGFDSSLGIDMVTPANAMIGSLIITQEIFQDCLQIMYRTDLGDRFWATNYVQSPETFAPVQHNLRELYGLISSERPFSSSLKSASCCWKIIYRC